MMRTILFLPLSAARILMVVCIAFFLAACQGMPQREDSASADAQIQSNESEIFYESVAAGAAIGAVAGGVIGNQVGDKNGTLIGAAVGTALGAVIGREYGKRKIYEYRDVRLKNDELRTMVQKAQEYNEEISAYNASLQADMAQLKKQNEEDQVRLAQLKLARAKAKQREVAARIEERKAIQNALVADQGAALRRELSRLEEEEKTLNGHIAKYKEIIQNGPVIG